MNCNCCPRHCSIDRASQRGFCEASATPEVASICIHKGEEPPISGRKGICNVFFAHCNLQCVFCQNYDISRGKVSSDKIFYHSMDEVIDRISEALCSSENMLGFVSPTHYAESIPVIVEALHSRGLYPTVVYNTNGYDDVSMLRYLEPYVDVYLPDMKYADSTLSARYSHAADYPEKAQAALLEMVNQKGASLKTDDEGMAFRGVIVRHLVLPGSVENSKQVLDWLADNMPPSLHIALMAQYFPIHNDLPDQLGRCLLAEEYSEVVAHYNRLGFTNGWVQELGASDVFRPDFGKKDSFEI